MFLERLGLSEVTFGGILHGACTCIALLRAALACLLAAVCEVYAGSSVGEQPFMLLRSPCFTDGSGPWKGGNLRFVPGREGTVESP